MDSLSVEQRQAPVVVAPHPPTLPGAVYLRNPNDFPGAGLAGDFETFNLVREDAKQASKAAVSHLVGFFLDFDIIDYMVDGMAKWNDDMRKEHKNSLLNGTWYISSQTYNEHLELIRRSISKSAPEFKARAVVATGYGYHFHYWFDVPVNVSGDDGEKIKSKYEGCMKRLIKTINDAAGFNLADDACCNVNRYVRMPGAFNRKGVMDGHTGELKLVRLVAEDPAARVSVDDFFTHFKPTMGRPAGLKAESSIDKLHQGKEWKNLPAWFTGKYALSTMKWVELLTECDLYINQKDERQHYVECLDASKHGVAKDKDCIVSEKDSGWWSFHCFHKQCQKPEILSVAAYLDHCGEEKVAQFCDRLNADAEKARKEVEEEEESEEPEEQYKHKYEYDDAELAELIVENILDGKLGYSVMDKSFYLYNGQFWVTRGQAKATLALVMPAFDELRKYRYLKVNKNDEAKWCRYRFSAQKEQGVLQCIVRYCMKRQNGDLREQRHIGLSFRNGFLSAAAPEDGLTENHQRNGVLAGHYMDFDYTRPEVEDGDFVGALANSCPVVSRVLHRLWKNDIDTRGNIHFFLQYLGAALLGKTIKYQKALLLVGPGRSGKSSILQLFRLCFPPDSVSGVSIQEMESRFGAGSLIGKRLNMVFDMASDMIMETARFKSAVCGEPMTIETKGIQGSVHHLTAAHVYACNAMPPVRRGDSGWWRRFIALKCENVLLDHEVDTKLESKMLPEIHALICLALECSFGIGDTYDVPKSSASVVGSWEIEANPIAMFLQQNYAVIAEEDKITGASSIGAPASIGVSSRNIEEHYNETMRKSGHKGIFSTGWSQLLSAAVKALGWPGLTDKKVQTPSGRNFVYPFRRA
jgi:P4 family phage/plasmid primase-like protien